MFSDVLLFIYPLLSGFIHVINTIFWLSVYTGY